jgi:hypothetical protein
MSFCTWVGRRRCELRELSGASHLSTFHVTPYIRINTELILNQEQGKIFVREFCGFRRCLGEYSILLVYDADVSGNLLTLVFDCIKFLRNAGFRLPLFRKNGKCRYLSFVDAVSE